MINPGLLTKQMQVPSGVASAVQNASARTGVDFSYLLKQAKVESSFDTDAKSSSSSATGLYQFIDQTWLRMVKEYGGEHGHADWASAITQGKNGRFHVTDDLKSKVMNARKDPEFSALMAGELAAENKTTLEGKLNRNVNSTDLYMAHFMGAGGASTFLSAMQDNPLQTAATLFPDAAKANRAVFYNADGTARSLGEVYEKFAAKFGDDDLPKTAGVKTELTASTTKARTVREWAQDDIIRWNDGSVTNLTAENRPYSRQGMPAAHYTPTASPLQTMMTADLLSSPLLALIGGSSGSKDGDKSDRSLRALAYN